MATAVEGIKINVGTKIDDVYGDKQAFEQARLADKNGDHVIDKDEYSRFVGPVFVENIETKVGRFVGGGYYIPRGFSGVILNDKEVDYYPGLTLDKIKDGRELKTFADIDIDGNKSLSTEEIKLYAKKDAVKNIKEDKKILNNQYEHRQKKNLCFGTVGTVLLGISVLIGGSAIAGCLFAAPLAVMGFGLALSDRNKWKNATAKLDKQLKELEPQVEKEKVEILAKAKEAKEIQETKATKEDKAVKQ